MILSDIQSVVSSTDPTTPVPGTLVAPLGSDEPLIIRIPAWAYLRAMANLFWSCIRHPLSETTIDLSTGRVLTRN